MANCPDHLKQVFLINGVKETLEFMLDFVSKQRQRAQQACCSYEADEKDYHCLNSSKKLEEVLQRAIEGLK